MIKTTQRPNHRHAAAKRGGLLRLALAIVPLVVLTACVSYEALEMTPEALRAAIRTGELIQPGDKVSVVTTDAGEHTMIVREVNAEVIRGTSVGKTGAADDERNALAVPINAVISVRVRELKAEKSIAAAAGWYLLVILATMAAFNPL